MDLAWTAVATNLTSLGRLEEASVAFQQARAVTTEPFTNRAARLWRDIVELELTRRRSSEAAQEVARFLDMARAAPAYFRAQALLAQAEMWLDGGNYDGALEAIRSARQGMQGDTKAADFDYEAVHLLMTCVLDAMNVLPYPEALALSRRIDTEFPGMPVDLAPFAELAMRTRRRLAGDIEGVLREDSARLEAGRRSGNVYLQVEALRSLATSYRSFNSVANEVASLEAAMELERGAQPAGGSAANPAANRVAVREWVRGLIQLSNAYLDARQLGKAGRTLTEAIQKIDAQTVAATRQDLAPLRAQAVRGKARVAELDDDADTARDLLLPLLAPGSAADRSDVLTQLARLERGEHPEQAVKYYEEAITLLQQGRWVQWEAAAQLELARLLASNGNPVAAREHLSAATGAAVAANFAGAKWQARFIAGIIREREGKDAEAVTEYAGALAGLDAIRGGLTQAEQRQALAGSEMVAELYQRMVAALGRLGRSEEAWRAVERGKARAFVEALQGRRFKEDAPAGAAPQLAQLEQRILGLRVQLAPGNEATLRGAGREPAVLRVELEQAQSQFALARQQAGLESTRASQALQVEPPPLRTLQAKLPAGTAVLEYFLLADRVTAFVVTRHSSQQVEWKANVKQLRGNVLRLRALLADAGSGEQLTPLLAQVAETVWRPVAAKLPVGMTRLVVVPAGYLNYVPFQVLPMEDGRAVIERYAVSYLPSASTLTLLGGAPRTTEDLFLGALGDVSVDGWAPLPGTLRETEGIARIFPTAVRASGTQLTHDRAVKALQESRQVHLATHGLLDDHSPLFSALLLSPAPGQAARLSLYELMDLKVRAQLVVLSACETGLGALLGGDEVAGLTRTLLGAGARTVVSSLWKVSDDATALLMQGFYRRLRAHEDPSAAMRAAALEVRKQYPHPFYWAPFLVTGAI